MTLEYTGSGSGKRYTIASKIKVVEAVIASKCSINSMSAQVGVSTQVITTWIGDYKLGKFSLENVNSIIRKSKTAVEIFMDKYDDKAKAKRAEILAAVLLLQEEGMVA